MHLSVITSIIKVILSFPHFLDIVIVLFLLISASIGYAKGFWKGTFRFIFVVIALLITWHLLLNPFANYVANDFFGQLGIKFKVGSDTARSLDELIRLTIKNANISEIPEVYLNEEYLNKFIISISKSIAWFISVLLIEFVSWIISSILYFLIIRLIIPEKIRKIKLRLLGALMGLVQGVIVTFAFMLSFANISPAFNAINNTRKGAFTWCGSGLKTLMTAFDPNNSMLSPYINALEKSMGKERFGFFVTVDGENIGFELYEELIKFMDIFSKIESNPPEEIPEESVELIVNSFDLNQ